MEVNFFVMVVRFFDKFEFGRRYMTTNCPGYIG
jgi:hypothetical protein